jgi:Ca2+-binding RTX toxin-like protein
VRLEGGEGDDVLVGGAGDDVLLGGEGDDLLLGNGGADQLDGADGRDFLVGGVGVDSLHGGAGEDLIVAGATAHDRNPAALTAIQSEWKSPRTYPERVANIAGEGVGERANGLYYLLPSTTVVRDEAVDRVFGEQDQDWLLLDDDDLSDGEAGETTTFL